jgi:hypothetical protein
MDEAESLPIIQLNQPHINMLGFGQLPAEFSQSEFLEISARDTLFDLFQELIYCVHLHTFKQFRLDTPAALEERLDRKPWQESDYRE